MIGAMTDRSPQNPQSFNAVLWWFRIIIGLQSIGIAGRYVFASNETDIYGLLFFDHGWPESWAQQIDDAGAFACGVIAIILISNGLVSSLQSARNPDASRSRISIFVDVVSLVFIAGWTFLLAAAHAVRGELFAELALGEIAVRMATPVAMIFLLLNGHLWRNRRIPAATIILVISAAITFAIHGYKALQQYGPFTDLILLTDQQIFQFGVEQDRAERDLIWIGRLDIGVAVVLLATRWQLVAGYMIVWGFITAARRMTAFGVEAWPDTLIRAANWGAPLLLLFLLRANSRQKI